MDSNLQSTLMRVGLIFVLFLIFYKPIYGIFASIQDMISRSNATNIKFQGFDIDLSNNKDPQSFDKKHQIYKNNFQMSFQLPLLEKYRSSLKKQLIDAKLEPNEQVNILLNLLANTQLCLSMLRIDKQLSKEQIELLSYLNNQTTPVTQTELLPFLKKEQIKYKGIDINFDRFINILFKLYLIDKNSSFFTVTDTGKAYLVFRVWSGYPISFNPNSKLKKLTKPFESPLKK
ncbi:MAG: hypothetical protein V4471_00870 [Pseudomonadota bacterium]